ncbi:hypothetical protein BDV93DRAFT_529022 [Ceratobasidium sp. AG-I]|nr:hypothetical protein BDV93DRAFT_529022 [Ceratobasidium sp. AG-I]
MSAGMATFFLLFILLSQVPYVSDPAAFMVKERVVTMGSGQTSTLSALSVSTAISHFLSITTPVVFSLLAYRTAHLWLRAQSSASADEEGVSRLPTPLHYGLLVRILNSSTILGLGSPAAYFIPRSGRNTIPTPRLLREAFGAAFIIYLLSHAVGLADIWLHAVSTVAIADAVQMADSLPDFSLAFNTSLCDPTTSLPCQSYSDHWGTQSIVRTGQLLGSNSTNPTNPKSVGVTTLVDANNTAILVPTDFVREWNFSATTYGARSQCYVISSYCAENSNECAANGATGPAVDAGMTLESLQIPKATTPSDPSSSKRGVPFHDYRDAARVMAYVGNVTVGSSTGLPSWVANTVPPNPGPVLIKLRWTDFEQPGQSNLRTGQASNPLIWVDIASGKADDEFQTRYISTLYAQCSLEFVKVRYGYNEMTKFVAYGFEEMSGTASLLAGVFWGPLIWQQITPQLVSNVRDSCVDEATEDGTMAVIEQELARLAITSVGGMLVRTANSVTDASVITQTLVGRYPRVPVFIFAGLLYAYAALAVVLFLSTAACTSDVVVLGAQDDPAKLEKIGASGSKPSRTYTELELAQRRLVNPLTLIAEQHVWAPHVVPSEASAMSARTGTAEMFGVGDGKERLMVGLGGPYADAGNGRFGVWRRPKRREAEVESAPSVGEMMEGTTMVGSGASQHSAEGMPPAYASLSRGASAYGRRGRHAPEGMRSVPEYGAPHGPGDVVRVDFGRPRTIPEKELSGLMGQRTSVSSEGSEASGSSGRTVRRSTGA